MDLPVSIKQQYEELACLFLAEEYEPVIHSPFRLRRYTGGKGERFYFSLDEDWQVTGSFLSVTSFAHKVLPTGQGLIDWKVALGKEESERITQERSEYGTLLHIEVARFCKERYYKFSEIDTRVSNYLFDRNLDTYLYQDWVFKLERDLCAWFQFVVDYEFEPVAIEFPIASERLGIGTLIDAVGTIAVQVEGYHGEVYASGKRKGEPKLTKAPKKVNAIIDLKSGLKGFHPEHEVQLHACKDLWNEHFSGVFEVDTVCNWSPKDWEGETPTYNFKDQTDSKEASVMPEYYALARKKGYLECNKVVRQVSGVCNFGESPKKNIIYKNMSEIVSGK